MSSYSDTDSEIDYEFSDEEVEISDEEVEIEDEVEIEENDDKDICPICLEIPNNPINLLCSHIFCYLCIKHFYDVGNHKCPICRVVLDKSIYERAKNDNNIAIKKGIHWCYSSRDRSKFWLYDNITSDIIEKAFQNNDSQVEVDILGKLYVIDFTNNIQYDKNMNTRVRSIKREEMDENYDKSNIQGISGLMENIKIC